MAADKQINKASFSMVHTFWRTVAFFALFIVLMVNYRHSLQNNSSVALMLSDIRLEHLANISLILDLLLFFSALIVLHLLWALIISISCYPLFRRISEDNIKTQLWLTILLLHLTLLLAANAYFHPTSLLGFLRETALAGPFFLMGCSLALLGLFLWGLYEKLGALSTLLVSCLVLFGTLSGGEGQLEVASYQGENPNVIIIGIDGLRPDHLEHRGVRKDLAPELDKLLSQSVIYDHTYTPMARTYTAWLSLLKGQYPITHGGRFNLAPPELIDHHIPLIDKLKQRGYQTTYATDERRFNQIDQSYGFNQVIGPKIGAADAIISSFADWPLVNLLANTRIAKYIFPYIYLNRAYGKAYDPKLFNREVLVSLAAKQPNFLAVHFCMLHWPYTSKDFISIEPGQWQGNYNHFMYQAMLKKLDRQISNLIDGLKQRGMLDNAIVYLMSDHGEGFMLPDDNLLQQQGEMDVSLKANAWGHGTNILNQPQADVLMAYSRYKDGKVISKPERVTGVFSLVDIVPSLFAQLQLELTSSDYTFDGKVLPLTNDDNNIDRMIFVESSLPVKSINASFIYNKKVLSETASNYEIRSDGRPVMKPDIFLGYVARKQRSVYFKSWQLVMLPDHDDLVLVDIEKHQWAQLSSYQGAAPWRQMLSALCRHYSKDAGFDHLDRCQTALAYEKH